MSTIHDYFMALQIGDSETLPDNMSRNELEYAVHGPGAGYPRQYRHLENGQVLWTGSRSFMIQCKVCKR